MDLVAAAGDGSEEIGAGWCKVEGCLRRKRDHRRKWPDWIAKERGWNRLLACDSDLRPLVATCA